MLLYSEHGKPCQIAGYDVIGNIFLMRKDVILPKLGFIIQKRLVEF